MKYLCYTYVDAKTGVPCTQAPMRNGPASPPVPGLAFGFALESAYPTAQPLFYGACPDESEVAVLGVLAVLTQAQYQAAHDAEMDVRRQNHHQRRRARRTQAETAGFPFRARRIDSDPDSVLRITQAALVASQALLAHQDFAVNWVCADDSILALDAAGMLAMQAALTAHGLACHNRSQDLRAALDEARDGPALAAAAVEIETGWPVAL